MTSTSANHDSAAPLAPITSLGLQKQALISFYTGSDEEARASLAAVKRQMPTTRMMDPQSLLVMSITSYRADRLADLSWCATVSRSLLEQGEGAPHVRRTHSMITALAASASGLVDEVRSSIDEIMSWCSDADFNLGDASSVVMVLSTIASKSGPVAGVDGAIQKIGMRFCGVIAATEMLCRAAWVYPRYADIVRRAHGAVLRIAQAAIAHSVAGDPAAAISELVGHAERLGNAKLIESARIAMQRHHASLEKQSDLMTRLLALTLRGGGKSHAERAVPEDCPPEVMRQGRDREAFSPQKVVK